MCIFNSSKLCVLFINIKLSAKRKKKQKYLSVLSLSLETLPRSALICLSPSTASNLWYKWGSRMRRKERKKEKRERKEASKPKLFETLNNFFSFVRSFFRSELNYWTVDSLDFFVLLCSVIEHNIWLHSYNGGQSCRKNRRRISIDGRTQKERGREYHHDFFEEKRSF